MPWHLAKSYIWQTQLAETLPSEYSACFMLIKLQVQSSLLILKSCFRDLWGLPEITDIIQPSLERLAYKCTSMYLCIHDFLILSCLCKFNALLSFIISRCWPLNLGLMLAGQALPDDLRPRPAFSIPSKHLPCNRAITLWGMIGRGELCEFLCLLQHKKNFSDVYRSWLSRKQVILTLDTSASTSPAFFFLLWFEFSPHSF